ncbi:MAG: ABC transporter permease [Vicinamibacterales bacterium]
MRSDLVFAWRSMWKSPATTVGALVALALGIGATTAMFGLLNAVLLRPLPYPEPSRLVELWGTVQREAVERRGASFADYFDWKARSASFEAMAPWFDRQSVVYGAGEPEIVGTEVVGGDYFSLLGVRPLVGRVLQPSDDAAGTDGAAVLGERLWERRFGRRADVVGERIQLDDRVFTIVGVVPAAFRGLSDTADVWTPVATSVDARLLESRGSRFFPAIARLGDGVAPGAAQSELDVISRDLERAYPRTNEGRGVEVAPLADEIFGDLRGSVALLFGAVALVLLIACANVASLLVARSETRRREVSLRLALGAETRDLLRLMLAESAWLVVIGGGAGWLLAAWAGDALLALSPVSLPSFAVPAIDGRMLAFSSGLGLVTTVALGLVPLATTRRGALAQQLRDGAQETRGAGRSTSMRLIVVAEVAMAVALLVGATLLGRSFSALLDFDPGFDPTGVLALSVQLPLDVRDAARDAGDDPAGLPRTSAARVAAPALLESLQALPGVRSAALTSAVPLNGASAIFYTAEGQPEVDATSVPRAYVHRVTPGYFATVGLPILDGRDFDRTELAEDSRAVIVSAGVARRFWPGERAIGRRIKRGGVNADTPWLTIVGVVADANLRGIPENPTADPDLYFPFTGGAQAFDVALRAAGRPEELAGAARAALTREDPRVAIYDVRPLEALVSEQLAPARFLSWLTGAFAVVAFVLALIGIYAVLAHAVRRRTHEIGIRAALGAGRANLLGMVVGQALGLVGAGLGLGLVIAASGARVLESRLFGISTVDPVSYLVVAALVLLAAVGASIAPAVRSLRVDPMVALRAE